MKKRVYNGCELSSPLYKQIVAEITRKQVKNKLITEYKSKRSKK